MTNELLYKKLFYKQKEVNFIDGEEQQTNIKSKINFNIELSTGYLSDIFKTLYNKWFLYSNDKLYKLILEIR